jgi:hypothetical protein
MTGYFVYSAGIKVNEIPGVDLIAREMLKNMKE